MQPNDLAQLLGVSANTVRRWTRVFSKYLTPTGSPRPGNARRLSPHDVRVLRLVAKARAENEPQELIEQTLDALQAGEWRDLPDMPSEWEQPDETITVPAAASRAYDMAQIAVLQRDLEQARSELAAATERVQTLEAQLTSAAEAHQEKDSRYHALELELAQARGQVAELQARLSGFSLAGGRSLSPAALVLITLAAGALLMLVAFVALRLAG